jgi:hypothetical protein
MAGVDDPAVQQQVVLPRTGDDEPDAFEAVAHGRDAQVGERLGLGVDRRFKMDFGLASSHRGHRPSRRAWSTDALNPYCAGRPRSR